MKKLIVLGLIVIIMVSMVVSSADISDELKVVVAPFKIIVDGEEKTFEMPIIVINGRTYLPLRETAETLGIGIDWIGEEKTIVVSTKEEVDFPYELNLFLYFETQGIVTVIYNINVLNEDGKIKLTVEYNKPYDFIDTKEFLKNGPKYEYSEEIYLKSEQSKKILDILTQDLEYSVNLVPSGSEPQKLEGWDLTVTNTDTGEVNEISFDDDDTFANDENIKELAKALVKLSPATIIDLFGDTSVLFLN